MKRRIWKIVPIVVVLALTIGVGVAQSWEAGSNPEENTSQGTIGPAEPAVRPDVEGGTYSGSPEARDAVLDSVNLAPPLQPSDLTVAGPYPGTESTPASPVDTGSRSEVAGPRGLWAMPGLSFVHALLVSDPDGAVTVETGQATMGPAQPAARPDVEEVTNTRTVEERSAILEGVNLAPAIEASDQPVAGPMPGTESFPAGETVP